MKKYLFFGIFALLIACGEPAENIEVATDISNTVSEGDQTDAQALLLEATDALLAVNTVSYTVSIDGFFIDGDTVSISGGAEIVLQKGATAEEASVYADFEIEAAGEVIAGVLATDGVNIYSIDIPTESFLYGSIEMGADRLMRNIPQGLVMLEYIITTDPYGSELNAESYDILEPEELNGVLCNVVQVNLPPYTSTWWFDAETSLPLANKISLTGEDGSVVMDYLVSLSDLIINDSEVDASQFILECPEGYSSEEYIGAVSVGAPAPLWTLDTPEGGSISLEDLRGKVVIMDFWATWCAPCRQVMPALQAIYEEKGGDNLIVIGVNTWEREDPAAFMIENGYTYPIVINGDAVAQQYFVEGIPTFYVIDQNGNVAFHAVGSDPANEAALNDVLGTLLPE